MLMDSTSVLLARGVLMSPPDAPNMQIQIIDGRMEDVLAQEVFQVVLVQSKDPARLGRLIHHRGDMIVLNPLRALGEEVRQNLRVPTSFESFVYPTAGGQVPIRANDLSCGGVAFYCAHDFAPKERFEIVIPITSEAPLLLRAEILRSRPAGGVIQLYAAQFVDMINDEERRVREAVFGVQLQRKN